MNNIYVVKNGENKTKELIFIIKVSIELRIQTFVIIDLIVLKMMMGTDKKQ